MSPLRLGFAQCDITPPLGLPLGGYASRVGGADAVLDPLFCRGVILSDGGASVAIAVLDLLHVSGEWVGRVRAEIAQRLGIPADGVLIAATHTHAGPGVFRSSIEKHDGIEAYEEMILDSVLSCLNGASTRAAAAELRVGSALVGGVAANRRNRSVPVDNAVRVLSAHGVNGQLLGIIANFACHSTVLPAGNHAYSGDLLGAACKFAAEGLGAAVLCINGAGGDVSTRFTRREQSHREVLRLGRILAEGIRTAVQGSTRVEIDDAPLAAATESAALRWRELPDAEVAMARLEAASRELEVVRARTADSGTIRIAQSRVEGAAADLWVSNRGGWKGVFGPREPIAHVQAIRCGNCTILAAPGELFSVAGQQLQRRLGGRVMLAGYANDYLGYFVPPAEVVAGGYEAMIAMVDPTGEPTIRDLLMAVAGSAGCTEPVPAAGSLHPQPVDGR